MSSSEAPDFDTPDLARAVEVLPEAAVHALPFGTIRLDPQGRIAFFSDAERYLSGFGPRDTIGRHYFTEIAPCLATESFLGRIERARTAGRLDIELGYVGDFDDVDKELRFRIQSAADGGLWIFTQRL